MYIYVRIFSILYERLEKLNINYKIDKNILIEQAIKRSLPFFEDEIPKIFVQSKDFQAKLEREKDQIIKHQKSESVTITIRLTESQIKYGFLYIESEYRDYFPNPTKDHVEDKMFVISTDVGEIRTHLEPAFRITHLVNWFKTHRSELNVGESVFIDIIEPFKKYILKI